MSQRRGAWLSAIVGLGCIVLLYQACGEMRSIGLGGGPGSSGSSASSSLLGAGGGSTLNPTDSASTGNSTARGGGGTSTDNPLVARVQMKIAHVAPDNQAAQAKFCITGFNAVFTKVTGTSSQQIVIAENTSGSNTVVVTGDGTASLNQKSTSSSAMEIPGLPSGSQQSGDLGAIIDHYTNQVIEYANPTSPTSGQTSDLMSQTFDFTESVIGAGIGLAFDNPWFGTVSKTPTTFATGDFQSGAYGRIELNLSPNCDSGNSAQVTNSHGTFISKDEMKMVFQGDVQITQAGDLLLDASQVVQALSLIKDGNQIPPIVNKAVGTLQF